MVSPCTGSSPFVAFAARLRASDSLAEAVFSHTRSLDARPAVPRVSRSHPVAASVFANVRAERSLTRNAIVVPLIDLEFQIGFADCSTELQSAALPTGYPWTYASTIR